MLGLILTKTVGNPISTMTSKLIENANDIERVSSEINEDTKKQTDVVQSAMKELEEMIIGVIQGEISMNVDRQSEIARTFAKFLKNFVERTSTEVAMGMMSISQQSLDARQSIEAFVEELGNVGDNIRSQEMAINQMVEALKSIVSANEEIKFKAQSSNEAADQATTMAISGQERIGHIAKQLDKVRESSEGVKDITDSLATITESIKILALNMSLKVEDIRDDTGKSYGFEAMSAKVQQLAEEVEGLLARSRDMLIPTINAIEKVSGNAGDTKEMIAGLVETIKTADEESRGIAERIIKQASDIDKVEAESENLRMLAKKTTAAIEAQGGLVKDVDEMLKDSEGLIETVNGQTNESVEGARKVTQMMKELRQTVTSIENGTGKLTEKSEELSGMFNAIQEMANKNRAESERLQGINRSVNEVTQGLSSVVKGT
jgi:methyl-accepting chemotaxis protein